MNFLPLGYPPLEAKGISKFPHFSTLYQIVKFLLVILSLLFSSCGSDDAPPPSSIQPYDFHHGIKPNIEDVKNLACMDGAIGQAKNFVNKLEETFIRQKVARVSAREELAAALSYHNNDIKQEFTIIKDRRNRHLQKIFNRMVAVVHDELPSATHQHPDYQIFLIEPKDGSEYLNAFTTGSGMVYLSSLFYDFCQDDDELAFIIGHELGHLILDHTTDNTRRFKIVETALGDYVGNDWTATISNAWNTISEPFNSFDEQITDFSGLYIRQPQGMTQKPVNAWIIAINEIIQVILLCSDMEVVTPISTLEIRAICPISMMLRCDFKQLCLTTKINEMHQYDEDRTHHSR